MSDRIDNLELRMVILVGILFSVLLPPVAVGVCWILDGALIIPLIQVISFITSIILLNTIVPAQYFDMTFLGFWGILTAQALVSVYFVIAAWHRGTDEEEDTELVRWTAGDKHSKRSPSRPPSYASYV